jgi:hypothetical protein
MTKIKILKGGIETKYGTLTPDMGILEVDWSSEELLRLQDVKKIIELVGVEELKPPQVRVVGKDDLEIKKKKGK